MKNINWKNAVRVAIASLCVAFMTRGLFWGLRVLQLGAPVALVLAGVIGVVGCLAVGFAAGMRWPIRARGKFNFHGQIIHWHYEKKGLAK